MAALLPRPAAPGPCSSALVARPVTPGWAGRRAGRLEPGSPVLVTPPPQKSAAGSEATGGGREPRQETLVWCFPAARP